MDAERLERKRLYYVWCEMRRRCSDERSPSFHNYGGRGIIVCRKWAQSFEQFMRDMGPRPLGATIERVNNNAGYSKSNCKWSTDRREQARNRRNVKYVTHQGQTKCLKEWAETAAVQYRRLIKRLEAGWHFEQAMTQPPACGRRRQNQIIQQEPTA